MMFSNYDKANIELILRGHGDWFAAHLIRLIRKADVINKERLRKIYPEEVAFFEDFMSGKRS